MFGFFWRLAIERRVRYCFFPESFVAGRHIPNEAAIGPTEAIKSITKGRALADNQKLFVRRYPFIKPFDDRVGPP